MFEVKREHCVTVLEQLLYNLCERQAALLAAIESMNKPQAATAAAKAIDTPKRATTTRTPRKKGVRNGKDVG